MGNNIRCETCGLWHGWPKDQCPACNGLVSYPTEFYETDAYKAIRAEENRKKKIEAIRWLVSEDFMDTNNFTISDMVNVAMDLHISSWRDGMAWEWVRDLLVTLLNYNPTVHDEFFDYLDTKLEELNGTTE